MADGERQTQGVIVQIAGDEYQISSQSDPAQVQRIAAYVDGKMRQIAAQHSGRVPKGSLAVLAAMEITGELFGAVQQQSRLTETAQENLDRLTRLVDERATLFSSMLERGRAPLRRPGSEPALAAGRPGPARQ
ncbi:MAG: cell division protein ZapA [Candidatus Latescibacterota bacterium]